MAIVELSSSVSVLIFLGLATVLVSTGEHAFIQDKLPALRHLPSTLCHLRCVKDSNKAISEKECVQSCQEKLTPSLEQSNSHDFSKRMIKTHFIRRQRSVHSMNALGDCQYTRETSHFEAKILLVNLTGERWIYIKWGAIDSSHMDFNWSSYAIIYYDHRIKRSNCVVVPKNQTDYLLKEVDVLKLPCSFSVLVVINPYGRGELKLQRYTLGGTPRTFIIPTVRTKDTAKLIGSIVGGLVAGVILLVILYCTVKWRRKTLCPDGMRMPPPLPQGHMKDITKERYYSCYYPESEQFRERVAAIVNYFRQNGYNVIMDRMVSEEIISQGPTRWGENQIRKAKKVLIFLSPRLVNLAMDGREDSHCQDVNRVWVELEVLRDIYTKTRSAAQMVCIAFPDVPLTAQVPLPLWAKFSYKWPDDALEILKRLNDRPTILPI